MILVLLLLLGTGAGAATFTAASCSQSDVNAVVNGPTHVAADGDLIQIPPGTCTWTSGVTVPSGIGISVLGTGTPNTLPSQFGAGTSQTTLIDNAKGGGHLFYFRPTYGASLSRVSLLTLSPATGLTAGSLGAPLAFQGTCTASGCPDIRVDNLTFPASPPWGGNLTSPSGTMIVADNVFGVLDHNSLYDTGSPSSYEFVNLNHSAWQGIGCCGDNSWATPNTFGTNQQVYIENNYVWEQGIGLVLSESEGGFDYPNGEGGMRVACRFNRTVGSRTICSNHGTESNGRPRGGRQMEVYGNSMSCPDSSYAGCWNNGILQVAGPRSGSLLEIGNRVDYGFNRFGSIAEYRSFQNIGNWGACDGTGPYDLNDPTTYFTGTIASVSGSNPYTITVNGSPSWTPNQWVNHGAPYSLHDSTINNGSEITGSSANTLTVAAWTSIPYAAGDSITIQRAYACIDQSGRGGNGATLLSGSGTPTPTGWVNEPLDPVYEAADTSTHIPSFGPFGANTLRIIANRDYYAEVSQSSQTSPTSPFDGTVGTGYGVLANRPTTCTPYVGYWATDQGNWNKSGNSFGQGQLFVCSAANTWTPYYTPYTYPHPLTSEATTPPASTPWSGILSSSRAIDWSHAGLPPTLPDGETTPNPWTPPTRTQCGSTIAAGASAATINAALAGCPKGTYVLLGPGTFTVDNANITFYTQSGVTLRGSGGSRTILKLTGNSQIQFGVAWSLAKCSWTSGFSPGTTTLTMDSCSGPPLVPGQVVGLGQCDSGYSGPNCATGSSQDNGGLYVCGDNDVCQIPGEGTGTQSHQSQMVYVNSVQGSGPYTVNFSPGLYMSNWTSANSPTVGWITSSAANNTPTPYGNGLEDLTVYASGLTPNASVDMARTYASWIKGVRFLGSGLYITLGMGGTKNSLVMNNYFFSNLALDARYPPAMQQGWGADNLVLNNIMASGVPWEGVGGNTGNVVAYNYARDTFTAYYENAFFEHNAGSAFVLFEGNQVGIMTEDVTHGTHNLNTWFRNYISGWDPPYESTLPRGLQWDAFARFENAVGNAIGSSLLTTYQSVPPSPPTYAAFIFSGITYNDPLAMSTSLRWGNCDTVTGSCRFESSEVPTALTGAGAPFSNPVPGTRVLPGSFFMNGMAAHPDGQAGLSWWNVCTKWNTFPTSCAATAASPFPPAGPDVSAGPWVNGHAYDIPAATAFFALPIDPAFQNAYPVTGSSWSNGIETLNVSGLPPTTTHLMGGFQLTGAPSACNPSGGELFMTKSTLNTVSYALPDNPGTLCTGTMKFPDVRLFDEAAYRSSPGGSPPDAPPPAPDGPSTAGSALHVRVYPNPWRADRHGTRSITFDGLSAGATLKLFTASGRKVKELTAEAARLDWDLTNSSGDRVASGIYLYAVTDSQGRQARGKIGVVR